MSEISVETICEHVYRFVPIRIKSNLNPSMINHLAKRVLVAVEKEKKVCEFQYLTQIVRPQRVVERESAIDKERERGGERITGRSNANSMI